METKNEENRRNKDNEQLKSVALGKMSSQTYELINSAIAGGIIGCYIEDKFPFYFINEWMLSYLEYKSEDEFIESIDGDIVNSIHPDDRERTYAEARNQLSECGEYVVEYRIQKKGGLYGWVHATGKRIVTCEGREAVIAVCVDITKQKEAQNEVMRLYNNIPGAVFKCSIDNGFEVIKANDGLFEFIGYTREEFSEIGSKIASIIHPDDLKSIYNCMKKAESDGVEINSVINKQYRIICKDKSIRWVSIKAQQILGDDKRKYFYCVFVDVTEEKHTQTRIKEMYEKELEYSAELSSANLVTNSRMNITKNLVESYVSKDDIAITQTGATYLDSLNNIADSAVNLEASDHIKAIFARQKLIDDYTSGRVNSSYEFMRRKSDGTMFWCNITSRIHQNPETGDIIAFIYSFDASEKKVTEQMLRKVAEFDYEYIFDVDIRKDTYSLVSLKNNIVNGVVPLEGCFSELMRVGIERHIAGGNKEENLNMIGCDYIINRLEIEPMYSMMISVSEASGDERVKLGKVFYTDKDLGRVCITVTDVTEVIRSEKKQKEEISTALAAAKQANAAKSDFLSRMSHEIRTPMNAIIGMSTIAARAIGNDEQVADCISKIGISSRFLLSLINDILDMSRIESGKMLMKNEKIPMEEFLNGINSICYEQAECKSVDYECIVDPMLDDYYMGDAMKLQQVLINIIGNAIKFTEAGGKVTFSSSIHKKTKNDAVIRFIVNDTGVGMKEEFVPNIFEAFSQENEGINTMYGGTGLGLAIAKSIVDMMDGKITVRSIKGIGSEFTVDVKLGRTEDEKLRYNQKKRAYSFTNLKTLVVDDDVTVCESSVAMLREMGIKSEWVDSGAKAISRVSEKWKNGNFYDMILIDWKMPEMSGIETARRIRGIVGPDVTIIIMTAYDWLSIEHEAKMAGVNLLISKPMFKSSIVSAFNKILGDKEEKNIECQKTDYDFTGMRVLLAEDHPLNTEIAVMLLEEKGFTVDTAENGLRAMEMFNKSPKGYYDAILMDIRMPIMDGLTTASNIRRLSNEDSKTIPIIAMTANAFDDDIEKSKAAGMNAHLAKPIDSERLYRTLHDFILGNEADKDE